jgi:uncharacterized Zn-finger protein
LTELSNDEKELLALFDEQISQMSNEDFFDVKEEIVKSFEISPEVPEQISEYDLDLTSESFMTSPVYQAISPNLTSKSKVQFLCVPCNKTFSHKCHYTQHMKTVHTGVKPYKCQRCGKKFATENELDRHAVKHDGLKPFRCVKCPKSYNNKVDLKRHEKNHESQAPHPCEICGRGFVRRDHLEKHYQSHERKGKKQLKSAYENGVNFL